MHRSLICWLPAGALVAALALAGCGSPAPTGDAPTAAPGITSTPAETSVPAETRAPAATSVPVETSPPAETTAPAATAAPLPTTAFPPDVPWVLVNGTLNADDEQLDFGQRGLPLPSNTVQASPDGAYIAYASQEGTLVVLETGRFTPQLGAGELAGLVLGLAFSPDGKQLAATLLDDQQHRWALVVRDLASGTTRTLRTGASLASAQSDPLPLIPRPVSWAPSGLFAEYVLWATDAPPRNLALIDPADGSERMLRENAHLRVVPAPGGARVAVITGTPGMGQPPTMAISVLEASGGAERVIVPEQTGFVRQLRWSPGGNKLLYASSENFDTQTVAVHAANADGSGAQSLTLDANATAPAFADLAWYGDQTALLLLPQDDGYMHLVTLPLGAFTRESLRPLAAYQNAPQGTSSPAIIYTPGE